MPFDLRQEHFPLDFFCNDEQNEEERKIICDTLKKQMKILIKKGTEDFLNNQKIRYTPLKPMRNEFDRALFQNAFVPVKSYTEIKEKIVAGQSFRLLGLPGLGKTRMVGESFRGDDVDVYYCDCKEQQNRKVVDAVEKLLTHSSTIKQRLILDNCDQRLCSSVDDLINEYGYNCQLITIHYDPSEFVDSGIEVLTLRVEDAVDVVKAMVDDVTGMPDDVRNSIIELSGGFPLMASMMIENYHKGTPIVNVSKKDVFERMLGITPGDVSSINKLKVLTAFSIFKFIGLYGLQEKQGRFIAGNRIVTNINGSEDDNLRLFKEVHGQYEKVEILDRQGNLVLMRLIPLAIYLCKLWFDRQTPESIAELINQICSCPDEGTRNMMVESLSRRITLLNEIPLARELRDGLTNPDSSPFLTEEVALSSLGSRLFLAFSEVNPESCAFALHRIICTKSDKEIAAIGSARRNLAFALDHLAFDTKGFRNAMLTLARLSLVETEGYISNNTTGLFVERFAILLSGTEAKLQDRLDVIKELIQNSDYNELIRKSLLTGLRSSHFHRSGGAEKQGTKTLVDYVPTLPEVLDYYTECLDILLRLADSQSSLDEISKVLASNARGYYRSGFEDFLFGSLDLVSPRKDFAWEEMKEALSLILEYDGQKRGNKSFSEISGWITKLTKEDYVYTLTHLEKESFWHYDCSYEESVKLTCEKYSAMARELIDRRLYLDNKIMDSLVESKSIYYNSYGLELSSYSRELGIQTELLDVILTEVLSQRASAESESILLFFLVNVDDETLLSHAYEIILQSSKKYLIIAGYAIKAEGEEKVSQLFSLLDDGKIAINDFALYFRYRSLDNSDLKPIVRRLIDYGVEGAALVLNHCHHLMFDEDKFDEEYSEMGHKCLLMVNLQTPQLNDYLYLKIISDYLDKTYDEELALHVHNLQEAYFNIGNSGVEYYLERLYRKVLFRYKHLLKERVLMLLDDKKCRHDWIELLRTCYSQDGEEEPAYTFLSSEEWFEWLKSREDKQRLYVLAMMFSYASGNQSSDVYRRLVNEYWGDEVMEALSSRFHTYSWTGSGMPLYQSRIELCKDFINNTTNADAIEWFKHGIKYWEKEIEQEKLQNAHERAMYE